MYLSIIIPVFNVEKYIKECLDSIIPQIEHRKDIELIIVNDGTKDNSMEIVNSYLSMDVIIRVINQENQGLSQARNNGLACSVSDYVWFVDSDDYLKEYAIDYFLEVSTANPDVDVFASYMDRYIESSNRHIHKKNRGRNIWQGKEYLFKNMPKGAAQRFIYKRSFLVENSLRFIPGILHEDGVWGCQMLYCANKVYFLTKSIYVYRLRSNGSIMSNIKIKSAYDLLIGHKILVKYLNENVSKEDYFKYRQYIFSQIVCAFGYCKPLFKTAEFKEFYKDYYEYIINEARWLFFHGSYKISVITISVTPKILMSLMLFRYKMLHLIKR